MTFKMLKDKNCQQRIFYLASYPLDMKRNTGFPRQTQTEGIHHTRPALQEMLKGVLQGEIKDTIPLHENILK